MCGIVGYVGQRNARDVVVDALRRMEYRGYDSSGMAVLDGTGGMTVRRRAGRLANLEEALALTDPLDLQGGTGIGHTRWATHGRPTDRNAHPHRDASGRFAVVHNGIIENFAALRSELEADGVEFASDTDSEVAVHLVARAFREGETAGDFVGSVLAVLRRLEEEVAAGETDEYRQAVLLEVQRIRTIIDFAGRHVYAPSFQLGEWIIPRGFSVIVAIDHMHEDAKEFADPERFDPDRFIGRRPPLAFLPFGGGTRRCVGAVFAQVEMDVVLRTVLRHFAVQTTSAPGEKVFSRGVAYTPKDGGRVTLRRRVDPL